MWIRLSYDFNHMDLKARKQATNKLVQDVEEKEWLAKRIIIRHQGTFQVLMMTQRKRQGVNQMVLIEGLQNAISEHRRGFSFAVQHHDLDSAMLFLQGMIHVLPPPSRPQLEPSPVAHSLLEDLDIKKHQWIWLIKAISIVETAISKWTYDNLDQVMHR